jgi:hypothetical protein
MVRSEKEGHLPIRKYDNGEFHVKADLVLASKVWLFMFFKNVLPLLRLLEGLKVIFLAPLPRLCVCLSHQTLLPTYFNSNTCNPQFIKIPVTNLTDVSPTAI